MSGSAAKKNLGIVLSTVTDTNFNELLIVAKHAEKRGLSTVYVNEGRGDAIALATAIALNTESISVGTNIANIYFRHPYHAANSVRLLSEASQGRARVGFGISHRKLLGTLEIDMGDARDYLKKYIREVKDSLEGKLDKGFLSPDKAEHKIPILVAANTLETAKIAGSVGDGIMPYLTPISSVAELISAAKTAFKAQKTTDTFDSVLSIPTFLCDNEAEAVSAAKHNLAFFANLPNYRRQWRRSGFVKAMDLVQEKYQGNAHRKEIASLIPNELVNEVCIYGNVVQCREKIEAFRSQGVSEPVLAVSPVSQTRHEATLQAIDAIIEQ